MKKIFSIFAIAFIITSMMTTTAFAHGGHGRGNGQAVQQTGYALCTVDDCEIAYSHQHATNWYCGQAGLSGDYEVCKVAGCTAIGLHEHDGEYYHCRNYGTGNGVGRGCHLR